MEFLLILFSNNFQSAIIALLQWRVNSHGYLYHPYQSLKSMKTLLKSSLLAAHFKHFTKPQADWSNHRWITEEIPFMMKTSRKLSRIAGYPRRLIRRLKSTLTLPHQLLYKSRKVILAATDTYRGDAHCRKGPSCVCFSLLLPEARGLTQGLTLCCIDSVGSIWK